MKKEVKIALQKLGYTKIISIKELSGGSVHYIYKIHDLSHGHAIVKWRGPKTKHSLGMIILQNEISYEIAGLTFFASQNEVSIPKPYIADVASGILVMSSIVDNGVDLKMWIDKNGMIAIDLVFEILNSIEKLLIFSKSNMASSTIGKKNDRFDNLFTTRFKFQDVFVVEELKEKLLMDLEHRCFILGGLSFKNIIYNGNKYGFCDLETFCYGHPAFDIGYYLGHVLLHLIAENKDYNSFFNRVAFFLSHSKLITLSHERDLVEIIILTILYRLDHPSVLYEFKGKRTMKKLRSKLNSLLSVGHLPDFNSLKNSLSQKAVFC
ncbi:MAG: hypothetical protein AAB484_03200 [Patescibacteria group bacterium]